MSFLFKYKNRRRPPQPTIGSFVSNMAKALICLQTESPILAKEKFVAVQLTVFAGFTSEVIGSILDHDCE